MPIQKELAPLYHGAAFAVGLASYAQLGTTHECPAPSVAPLVGSIGTELIGNRTEKSNELYL